VWGFEVAGRRGAVTILSQLRSELVEARLRRQPLSLDGARSGEIAAVAVHGLEPLEAYFGRFLPQAVLAVAVPIAVLVWVVPIVALWSNLHVESVFGVALLAVFALPTVLTSTWRPGVERAAEERGVVVSVSASGGARMQEGILALMQLPKTVAAVGELQDSGGALLSVLAHPTTGGVTASFASLGDVILAEPGALTSFAGPRVVAQTTREKLPDDFGLAESNLRFGHVDAVVPRAELRSTLARLLRLFGART